MHQLATDLSWIRVADNAVTSVFLLLLAWIIFRTK